MTGTAPRNVMLEIATRFRDGHASARQTALRDSLKRATHTYGPMASMVALSATAPLALSGNPSDALPALTAAVAIALSEGLGKHVDAGRAAAAAGRKTLRSRLATTVDQAPVVAGAVLGGATGTAIGALAQEHAALLCTLVGMVAGAGMAPIAEPKPEAGRRFG